VLWRVVGGGAGEVAFATGRTERVAIHVLPRYKREVERDSSAEQR